LNLTDRHIPIRYKNSRELIRHKNSPPPEGWILSKKEDGVVKNNNHIFPQAFFSCPLLFYTKFCSLTARCWIQRRKRFSETNHPVKNSFEFSPPLRRRGIYTYSFYIIFVLHVLNLKTTMLIRHKNSPPLEGCLLSLKEDGVVVYTCSFLCRICFTFLNLK